MKLSLPKIGLLVVMVAILVGVAVGVTLALMSSSDAVEFPKEFKFGAATASYQIEGGWNADGKSPSIWDTVTQNKPGYIFDNSTGNVAADSYHMVDKDIEALENIGVSKNLIPSTNVVNKNNSMRVDRILIAVLSLSQFEVYRFSIAWTRIIPDGSKINMKGIEYYGNLIDKLLARNIEPLVTIYHWGN
jgi:beta-glucosidase/6-phospho-beta-glucosidase/beta-galactosidase